MDTYREFVMLLREKLSQPGVQKHSKNISWMFFARIGSMAITFFATAFIARNLGPTNYGQLSYAISYVSLFAFIASLGIDQILHRDLVKYPEKKNELLGSAIVSRAVASIVAVIITTFSAIFLSEKDVSFFLIFIISLSSLFGSFQLLGYEFQAETKSKYPSVLSLVIVFILNVLKVVTIFLNQGVIYLAAIVLLEPILYSAGYLYLKAKYYKDVTKLSFDKNLALSMVKDSSPLILASAFYAIYTRIDQVMIKNMMNAEAVGLYDAAVRISELSYFIPSILLVALFPAIIQAKKTSPDLYFKRMKKLFFLIIIISSLIAVVTALLSKVLVLTIYGKGFLGALPVLQIYAWSNIGAALNLFGQQALITENSTKIISLTTFLGMITNVVLNLLLIPLYGMEGAALATLISYMIPFLSFVILKKTRTLLRNILTA